MEKFKLLIRLYKLNKSNNIVSRLTQNNALR